MSACCVNGIGLEEGFLAVRVGSGGASLEVEGVGGVWSLWGGSGGMGHGLTRWAVLGRSVDCGRDLCKWTRW